MTNNFEHKHNGEYLFRYLAKSTSQKIKKFNHHSRTGNHTCDWTGGSIWGSPVIALAPPRTNDHGLALNIDTYINYVDK